MIDFALDIGELGQVERPDDSTEAEDASGSSERQTAPDVSPYWVGSVPPREAPAREGIWAASSGESGQGGEAELGDDSALGPSSNDPAPAPVLPILNAPRPGPPQSYFEVLFKGEGKVIKVGADEFEAVVHDLSEPDRDPELVAFAIREIPPPERPLIMPGAIFYWSVGYQHQVRSRNLRRQSVIRFRRVPVWSRRDQDALKRDTAGFGDVLGAPREFCPGDTPAS